jgi:hypothetical protein
MNAKIKQLSRMAVVEADGSVTAISKIGLNAAEHALNANESLDIHSLLCVAVEAQDAAQAVPARI